MIHKNTFNGSWWVLLLAAPLLFLLPISSTAQKNFTIRHFEEVNGISSNFCEAITQSSNGQLIVANKGGIDLFDGKTFNKITLEDDSIGLGYITSIYKAENEVWFGRFDGAIGVYERNTPQIIKTGIDGQIKHIYKDAKEGIWAFSRSGSVFWANGTDTSRYDMSERDMLINAVIPYKHKEFIIGSNDGLWLIRFEVGNDFQVLRHIDGLPETKITALHYESRKDQLWVGTEDAGLFTVQAPFTKNQEVSQFKLSTGESVDDVQTIFADRLGRIWLGTFGNGLIRLEFFGAERFQFVEQRFEGHIESDQLIRDIFQDNESNIWIATFGGGLVQIVENVFHQPFDENWLKEQSITQLFRDSKGNVWLGIDKGLFKTSEYAQNSKYEYHYVGGNEVTAISEDKFGTIWVGTLKSGIYRLDVGSTAFDHIDLNAGTLGDAINYILPTNGGVMAGTKSGLLQLSFNGTLKRHLTTLDGLPHNNVKFSYLDNEDRLWVACQGNRIAYLWKDKVRFIEKGEAQNIVDVSYILQDAKGRLWFSTMGNGIFVLENGIAHPINTENGLPSNYCYQMVLDNDGFIWVSHQKSITQLTSDLTVNRIVNREELSPTENSMVSFLFKDQDGNIWISSTHNVVKFNPSIDKSSKSAPQLSISEMLINGIKQQMIPNLKLPYDKYDISFKLAGISLRNPDKIKYKYQWKGLSDAWQVQDGNDEIKNTIPNGDYTLIVYASKNGGEWTTEPVIYQFSVSKPWWLTWWFWTLFGISLTLGVIAFVRYRTYKLIKDKTELEQLVYERTVEIEEQKTEIERSRDEIAKFAKDITDSIKYAKRIQKAIFPAWRDVQDVLPNSFVFFQSKDLVSGDFYLAERVGSKRIFCAVDCTGHGVPGGFMSIVANNLLQQAIRQIGLTKPSEILEFLNLGVTNTLHQTYEESTVKDGMDIALCCWDEETDILEFAGAYNPLYLFRDGELQEIKGNRFPVGTFVGEEIREFTNHSIQVQSGDMVYIFSDGFADQFGGHNGKKFMIRRFKAMLQEIHTKPVDDQYDFVSKQLQNWKGNLEQVDDIIVMGVRIA